jgi:N-carbamoyl-L-amino-acid hydrolase
MDRREFGRGAAAALAALAFPGVARAAGAGRATRTARGAFIVDGARVNAQLAALAEFGKNPQGGVSRVAYGDADRQGRAYVMDLLRAAKLDVRVDAGGNIIGRRAGRDRALPPIVIGSHIDSVPEGGNFDGTVGSLAAIEVARSLEERRHELRHPLEVVVWANEEGGLIGSRIASGDFLERELDHVTNSGKTIRDGIAFIGGDVSTLAGARREKGSIAAYVELHIEQGGTLEAERIDVGVVEGIVGVYWWDVTVTGFANHAGTTAMDRRQDALLAAARFIDMVHRTVRSVPGRQVGTVGKIVPSPGARNVIAGHVALTLELRDLDEAKVRSLYSRIEGEARRIGEATGTTFALVQATAHGPAFAEPRLREIIDRSARASSLSTRSMPSGAGHDAQSMAHIGPMGMIFIPSIGGISHSPKEFSRAADIEHGAAVLARVVEGVDGEA